MAMATRMMNSAVQDNPGPVLAWDGDTVEKRWGGRLKERRSEAHEKVEDGAVIINGQVYHVIDWSASAFSAGVFGEFGANPSHIDCELMDWVDIKFSIQLPTKRIKFEGCAIVVRIDKERQELAAHFAVLDDEAQIAIADHFADDSMTGVATPTFASLCSSRRQLRTMECRKAEEARRGAGPTKIDLKHLTAADAAMEQEVDGGDPIGDRTEAIKRRAAEIAAEIAKNKEDMRSVIFDLGIQNLAAFRKKVDAAGITQVLQETPQIKVHDHDHAYGFRLGKMEYAVFADWDSGRLCRDMSLEESTRRPRITDFDHDDALNEMVDCLARMLATVEASGAL